MPPAAACRFTTANPAPRSSVHPPGAHLDETIRRFTRVHPSGLPLAYAPGRIEGRFGFFPELRTPPLPATHVRAGTGHRTLTRATSSTSPPTSISTCHLHMRPRVAPPTECLSARWTLTFSKPRIPRQTGTSVRYAPYSSPAT